MAGRLEEEGSKQVLGGGQGLRRPGNPGAAGLGIQAAPAKPSPVEHHPARRARAAQRPAPGVRRREAGSEPRARDEAGKAARMRRPAARAPQDGEGKVEFSSGNLTR